jgi:hypothetical protein
MVAAVIVTIGAVVGFDGDPDAIEAAESEFRSVAVSVTEDQPPLVVAAASEESDAGTAASAATTRPEPPAGGSTASGADATITVEARIEIPAAGAVVNGDLDIAGTATFPEPPGSVELTIMNLETSQYWNPRNGRFQESVPPFPLEVASGTDTWNHRVASGLLAPGRYRIQVQPTGQGGESTPGSDSRTIVIAG